MEEGVDEIYGRSYVMYGRNVVSGQLLEVSLLGVGTVLRLERVV